MADCSTWIACICDSIVRDVIRRSHTKCAGCQSSMSSPLLHRHETQGLLEKLDENFEETRIYMIGIIPKLYEQFQHLISTDAEKDRETFYEAAKCFLLSATSRSIFYGQFVNAAYDETIRDAFKPKRRYKRKKSALEKLVDDLDITRDSQIDI